ncbi:MAG: hypothetical protein ACQEW2_23255 [Bacillota bacterium]|uniref:hypothetical protein n=1 Tax=Cytobacillus firmus TaxID=1399 RepID=UPI0012E7BF9C|nr:hypothetical protein [Cytobacillus firmus]MEC1892623.1 hypothetical protein [Cytobacillus firmus]MED4449724.1 hypothetical protein [Cytobacillus firmus]MED4770556.1 hypothetical protein [Cytobacillus firmus]
MGFQEISLHFCMNKQDYLLDVFHAIVKEQKQTLSELRLKHYDMFEGMGFDPIQ